MVVLAVAALAAGVLYGILGSESLIVDEIVSHRDLVLYLLMFCVGISIGLHRGILRKLREYNLRIFLIPLGVVAGSLAGGAVCSFLTPYSMGETMAMASGLGWYSLAGVTVSNMAGAQAGSVAFLSNLMREIFSFFWIGWIARHLNYASCIAIAGATSEDTTLPMIMRYCNEETVVLAVINGVVCSSLVPILISFCFQAFG
ncbi:MAG TPA: lysine exporter LysO family protein [Candidatus Hungatella pullicola]|nr:lysine exporter LysO family protein [Candidatus Hungatella pullicola]